MENNSRFTSAPETAAQDTLSYGSDKPDAAISENDTSGQEYAAPSDQYFDIVMEAATIGDMLSAKRRLGQLYRTGSLVEQSNAEAVRWYSLAALQAINELTAKPDISKAEGAFNILFELGELHYEIGDSQRAISTFLRMEAMLDSLPEELNSSQTDRWMQICSNKLGGLYERTAKPEAAYRHFTRALAIAERTAQTDKSEIALDDLAVACYRVGFMDHLFRRECEHIDRASSIWSYLYEQTGNYDYRRKKSVIDTLYAASGIQPSAHEDEFTVDESADASMTAIEPARDQDATDALAAELNEYIRQNGYSSSNPLERMRPLLDALGMILLVLLCVWAYFSGVFHAVFRFLRELF